VERAMHAMANDYSPMSDARASADYRLKTAQSLLLRYLHEDSGLKTSVLEVSA
jgi:xanthine dehydrogenase small subunit